jgi:hypothetical protein
MVEFRIVERLHLLGAPQEIIGYSPFVKPLIRHCKFDCGEHMRIFNCVTRHPRTLSVTGLSLVALATAAPLIAQQERRIEPAVKITTPRSGEPLGILAEANLKAKRPAPGANFMGTWLMQRTATNGPPPDWEFWPMPKLTAEGQRIYKEKLQADAEGKAYKDDAALCYPPGMPRFLTRVWPIQIIQLPTAIVMIQGFENQVRWVYLDGRKHPDPDYTLPSFNGDSIGHWEGNTLVIDTRNFEPGRHWIQSGVPVGEALRIIERWKLTEGGKVLEIQLTMTDSQYWEGEWVNTKRYNLRDDRDLFEVHCIPEEMARLPSAQPNSNTR